MTDAARDLERMQRVLASDATAGVHDGLVVMDPTRPYHHGTTVPVLTRRFVERPDGLAVPQETLGARLSGSALRYMTGEILLDVQLGDVTILEFLAGHPVDDVLAFCGSVLNGLARRKRDAAQAWAVESFLVGEARTRATALLRDDWVFLTPQVILAAAKLRLLLRDAAPRDAELLGGDVMSAILGVADRLAAERSDEDLWGDAPAWLVIEMLQNQYFNASDDVGSLLARGRRLREHMADLDAELAARLDALFEEITGAPFELVTMVGLALYTGTADNSSVAAGYFDEMRVPEDARQSALAVLAANAATLQGEARDEFDRLPGKSGFDWGYNTFRKYPALRHADGRVFTIHPEYLLERCTFDAFELKVRMELRRRQAAGDPDANRLEGAAGDLFGRAHEAYVGESVDAQVPQLAGGAKRRWSEAELQSVWPGRRHCDFVIDCGTAILALEVVSKGLIEQSYAAGAIDALERDLEAIVDKKARQLHSTISCLIDQGRDQGIPQSAPSSGGHALPRTETNGQCPLSASSLTAAAMLAQR